MENYKLMLTEGRLVGTLGLFNEYFQIAGQSLKTVDIIEHLRKQKYAISKGVITGINQQNNTHMRYHVSYTVHKHRMIDVLYIRRELSDALMLVHNGLKDKDITAILKDEDLKGFILNEELY